MTDERKWQISKVKIKDLVLNDVNPRFITTEAKNKLNQQIKEVGFNSIIIVDNNNIVLAGNQRVSILKEEYGNDYEIDIKKPLFELTERQRKLIMLWDNKHNGEFDIDILKNEYFIDIDLKEEIDIDLSTLKNFDLNQTTFSSMVKNNDFFAMTFQFEEEKFGEYKQFMTSHKKEIIDIIFKYLNENAD